jgi:hypothetical protein
MLQINSRFARHILRIRFQLNIRFQFKFLTQDDGFLIFGSLPALGQIELQYRFVPISR